MPTRKYRFKVNVDTLRHLKLIYPNIPTKNLEVWMEIDTTSHNIIREFTVHTSEGQR